MLLRDGNENAPHPVVHTVAEAKVEVEHHQDVTKDEVETEGEEIETAMTTEGTDENEVSPSKMTGPTVVILNAGEMDVITVVEEIAEELLNMGTIKGQGIQDNRIIWLHRHGITETKVIIEVVVVVQTGWKIVGYSGKVGLWTYGHLRRKNLLEICLRSENTQTKSPSDVATTRPAKPTHLKKKDDAGKGRKGNGGKRRKEKRGKRKNVVGRGADKKATMAKIRKRTDADGVHEVSKVRVKVEVLLAMARVDRTRLLLTIKTNGSSNNHLLDQHTPMYLPLLLLRNVPMRQWRMILTLKSVLSRSKKSTL